MIKINSKEDADTIVSFLNFIKNKQFQNKDTDNIIFTKISLYNAAKFNLIGKLLSHPLNLVTVPFYEPHSPISPDEIKDFLASVLEYEFINENPHLPIEECDKLIQIHKKWGI